jgi:hypothetical protein
MKDRWLLMVFMFKKLLAIIIKNRIFLEDFSCCFCYVNMAFY